MATVVCRKFAVRNLVVILGAGASVSSGLPSLAGVFEDAAVQRYLKNDAKAFEQFLKKYIWEPRGIAVADRWSSLNLEEILTMLRLWEDDNQSPINWNKNQIYQRQLLGCVYQSVYVDKFDNYCRDYNQLIKVCDANFDSITWASYNWDAKFEQAFYHTNLMKGIGPRLPRCADGLEEWEGTNLKHLFLKLHGSVSWFYDSAGRVFYKRFGKVNGDFPIRQAWDSFLKGNDQDLMPMIVEPSFLKHEHIKSTKFLKAQWRTFDTLLGKADLVLVVGYSLPDGDANAKQSLLTAVARNPTQRPTRWGQTTSLNWLFVKPASSSSVSFMSRNLSFPELPRMAEPSSLF